jgi:hypothetical protein
VVLSGEKKLKGPGINHTFEMKLAVRILSLVVLASLVTLYTNCGGDDPAPASKEKVQLDKLVGSWDLTSVTDEAGARTDFTSVVMTISGTYAADGGTYNYSCTGTFPSPSPMPKTAPFKFGADPNSQLLRVHSLDPTAGFPMNYTLSNNNQNLQITFNYVGAGFAGGRISNVEGDWVFNFTKQ